MSSWARVKVVLSLRCFLGLDAEDIYMSREINCRCYSAEIEIIFMQNKFTTFTKLPYTRNNRINVCNPVTFKDFSKIDTLKVIYMVSIKCTYACQLFS